jgi:predicted alpha/beta hydrolase
MSRDLETVLSTVSVDVDAVLFADDWLAPRSSLDGLLGKLQATRLRCSTLDATTLGTKADHFAWMQRPEAVALALALAAGRDQSPA